jgi:hypothetical protein
MKHVKLYEDFLNEAGPVREDSAGRFELEKDWSGKDAKGKEVKLRKGTVLKHERSGGWGPDYLVTGSISIPAENIPQEFLSDPW